MNLEFVEDLPGTVQSSLMYGEIARSLKDRPGTWARWPIEVSAKRAYTLATNVNVGRIAAFRGGDYEGKVASGVLYVRYTGGES